MKSCFLFSGYNSLICSFGKIDNKNKIENGICAIMDYIKVKVILWKQRPSNKVKAFSIMFFT